MTKSPPPILCHLLVGPPASGKTTFSKYLQSHVTDAVVVSTDEIRGEQFGDAEIQGDWATIEKVVLEQIHTALRGGQSVIYDATNVRRCWRLGFLEQLATSPVQSQSSCQWVAWVLTTPLTTCLQWNQQRPRQVPEKVIIDYAKDLLQFAVEPAEGFVNVIRLDPAHTPDLTSEIQTQLAKLKASQRNRQNRHKQVELHAYSRLLDFERLLHLIALLSHYPGLGDLQQQAPLQLMQLLNSEHLPSFPDPIAEIAAVLTAQQGWVYANPDALSRDMAWLEANGFLDQDVTSQPLDIPPLTTRSHFWCHPYSDRGAFQRLMGTIRYIIQNPLSQEPFAKTTRDSRITQSATSAPARKHRDSLQQVNILAQQLQDSGIVPGDPLPMLRKDIERILKPYRIFPDSYLRKGYYLGTGILSQSDLLALYDISQKYATSSDDVLAKATVQHLAERLGWAQMDCKQHYPIRSIAKSSIVNPNLLSPEALISEAQSHALETDIRQGNIVCICRRKGAASHGGALPEEVILPLQIFFYNIAWYLGYQVVSGDRANLFCFERLDRLFRGPVPGKQRPLKQQKQALAQLETLFEHSFGLYLGKDATQQQAFLTATPHQRQKMMETLDLRFTASMFSFISEGTQRFPLAQVQMSQPKDRDLHALEPGLKAKLFSLKLDRKHPEHPYQMRLKLPPWSFEDVTLKAWILGMGPEVKVLAPEKFQNWIIQELQTTQRLY